MISADGTLVIGGTEASFALSVARVALPVRRVRVASVIAPKLVYAGIVIEEVPTDAAQAGEARGAGRAPARLRTGQALLDSSFQPRVGTTRAGLEALLKFIFYIIYKPHQYLTKQAEHFYLFIINNIQGLYLI